MTIFKDKKAVNNISKYENEAKKICEQLEKYSMQEWFRADLEDEKPYNPNFKHEDCGKFKNTTTNGTEYEKRICKCLYYFNSNTAKRDCENCLEKSNQYFQLAISADSDLNVVEYEVPPVLKAKGLGNIDLVLKDEKFVYATEVKPPNSKETLLRMVAEIMTYCKTTELNSHIATKTNDLPVRRAIAFFEGSEQAAQYLNKAHNHYGKYTKKIIELFDISVILIKLDNQNKKIKLTIIE